MDQLGRAKGSPSKETNLTLLSRNYITIRLNKPEVLLHADEMIANHDDVSRDIKELALQQEALTESRPTIPPFFNPT